MSHEDIESFIHHLVEKHTKAMLIEYHDWLENRAVVGPNPPPDHGSLSISNRKASEIRSFVRVHVNDTEHKHMTKSAKHALFTLLAQGNRMLDELPDREIIEWYENWVAAVN